MLEKLTPEQEELMVQVRDEWIDLAFKKNKEGINEELFEKGVKWLYEDLLKLSMPEIVYCDSWTSCLANISALKKLPIDNAGAESVHDMVTKTISGVNKSAAIDGKNYFGEHSGYIGWSNFGWMAFYDFFDRIGVIENEDFRNYRNLIRSNCFNAYEYEKVILAIQPPYHIYRNNEGRLNATDRYAVEFRDGTGYYFINGRHIPDEVFNKAKKLTREQFVKETNSDFKGAWYEILGQKKVMELLGAKEIDSSQIVHRNGDIETVTLIKTADKFKEIDNQPFAWVKMVCPSTGTSYLQGVEPHHKDALSAIASLSPFKKEDYSFDIRL